MKQLSRSSSAARGGSAPRRYLLVTMTFLLLTVPFLGAPALFDPDEGYYPETAREMLELGNSLDPVFNGEPRWGKPIGIYFLQCFTLDVFGLNETAARLPSLVSGLAFTLLTLSLGTRLYGPRGGLYAGLAVAGMVQTVIYSRTAVPDMLLATGVALALLGFACSGLGRRKFRESTGAYCAMYLGCALAFLAKGPLGVILPGLTVLAFLVLSRDLRGVTRLGLIRGGLIFLATAGPWFFYMYHLHGVEFLHRMFIGDNLERYFTDRWQHDGPLHYYLPVILFGTFPWTAAVAGGLARSFRPAAGIIKGKPADDSSRADLFTWVWLFGMLLFFSFSRSKLPNYVLPLYPAAALAAARFMLFLEGDGSRGWKLFLGLGTAVVALAALGAGGAILPRKTGLAPSTVLMALSPLALVAAASLVLRARNGGRAWTGMILAGMALFFALITGLVVPRVDSLNAVKRLSAGHIATDTGPSGRILFFRTWAPSALFYSRSHAVRFDPDRESLEGYLSADVRWVLVRDRNLAELVAAAGREPEILLREGPLLAARFSPKVTDTGQPEHGY